MGEYGLTAFIVTIHLPSATLALALGLAASALAMIVMRRRPLPLRAWIGALWFAGVVVVGYAGITRVVDVRGFDAEQISILP
jgi:hypothetical protein